ncbi:oligosaccharide flippase family protein [Granulicella sibirica]|uniref:O-antigen flippase Wzx n=1 Tax=Granulicella sibirica TaxID=2479048 RepID=A0A4Q0T6Z1_9BACT|nr:oligosaccharide flippase family protein [Granulicella sibirica]RXH58440.1 O-antigen flippase Wzx [Granulicella sibirica]
MEVRWRLAKNATANLVRGGTAGVVAIFLPAVLVRHMDKMEYAVWVLVLQVAAYSSYLDFGLQTAVGRYVAIANERHDTHQRDSVFSTALVGLSIASLIAVLLLVGVACATGILFPKVPVSLLPSMRGALLIVGSSIALGLPSSAWSGVFIGMQRNELIAAVMGSSKLISAIALIVAALHGASIVTMAVIVAMVNLASYGSLYLMVRYFSETRFRLELVQKSMARELFNYCFSLMIWSFSTLLITGLDLLFVGHFDLEALVPYALATSLVTFIAGVQTAVFGAMMPHAAVLHARGDAVALGNMVISTTRLAVTLLSLTGLPLLIYSSSVFRIWVGHQYVSQGHMLLVVLMAANIIRLTGTPYSIVLVASGQQKLVTLSPLLEGLTNLLASIVLGVRYGAGGVAAGTLIGGVVGMLGHVIYNMPRTHKEVTFGIGTFLISGFCIPALTGIPLIALLIYPFKGTSPPPQAFALACGLTLVLVAGNLSRSEIRKHTST